jgi:CRISPR/Cas system-associated exonuclease Cas4 (RecB family)
MVADSKAALEDPDEYLNYYFTDGRYKAGFQAYYYASLVNLQNPVLTLMAGIFSTRTINDGIRFLRKGKVIDTQILTRYREKLKDLIEELMDPKVPFEQTDDHSKCRVCAYKAICRR